MLFDMDQTKTRMQKPRNQGLTMMMDKGLGWTAFQDCLLLSAKYIDFIKLGFGTMSLTPPELVKRKVQWANKHQVVLYAGGTFFEIFASQGKADRFFGDLSEFGMTWVEISDGVISLDVKERSQMIHQAQSVGLSVITEVGKKEAGRILPAQQLIEQIKQDLYDGAAYVIVEGRESGENVGIFNKEGQIDLAYVDDINQQIDPHLIIWEAPKKEQQVALLHRLGTQVNLGNISSTDVLSLESLRRGLRADTFWLRS